MAAAKRVSTRDVTLGGAIRRESLLLGQHQFDTREKKNSVNNIASGFPANMNAYPQLLVSNALVCFESGDSSGPRAFRPPARALTGQRLILSCCIGVGVKRPGTVPNGTPQVPASPFLSAHPSHEINSPAKI